MDEIDIDKYPTNFQICRICCILACIQNIIRYYGGHITQRRLLLLISRSYNVDYSRGFDFKKLSNFLNFEDVSAVIENRCYNGKLFEFKRLYKKDFSSDYNRYWKYLQKQINNKTPVIVATKEIKRTGVIRHALTVIGIDKNNVKVFDTADRSDPVKILSKDDFKKKLANKWGMLVIKKKC